MKIESTFDTYTRGQVSYVVDFFQALYQNLPIAFNNYKLSKDSRYCCIVMGDCTPKKATGYQIEKKLSRNGVDCRFQATVQPEIWMIRCQLQ